MNKCFLIGNLTRDPELHPTKTGNNFCTFTIAVNRKYSPNGEKVTDFFKINAFGKLAENCTNFLAKGRKVSVIGEVQQNEYTDKNGIKRKSVEISAEEVEFLSRNTDQQIQAPTVSEVDFTDIKSDDVPF